MQFNPDNGEPYLTALDRHDLKIIITPLRESDKAAIVSILNDPPVCDWLQAPPYPYLPEHADAFVTRAISAASGVLSKLKEIEKGHGFVGICPFQAIRQVSHDGGPDEYIGDITLRRDDFLHCVDAIRREQILHENEMKEVGDPAIIWCFGGEHACIKISTLKRKSL